MSEEERKYKTHEKKCRVFGCRLITYYVFFKCINFCIIFSTNYSIIKIKDRFLINAVICENADEI